MGFLKNMIYKWWLFHICWYTGGFAPLDFPSWHSKCSLWLSWRRSWKNCHLKTQHMKHLCWDQFEVWSFQNWEWWGAHVFQACQMLLEQRMFFLNENRGCVALSKRNLPISRKSFVFDSRSPTISMIITTYIARNSAVELEGISSTVAFNARVCPCTIFSLSWWPRNWHWNLPLSLIIISHVEMVRRLAILTMTNGYMTDIWCIYIYT